ncbi:MAG: hypothetical protein ACI9Y7_001717 [Dokdonia sp.]|jgi:hypothetical protein
MKNLKTVILNVALLGILSTQSVSAQNNSDDLAMNNTKQTVESYIGTDNAKTHDTMFKRNGDVVFFTLDNLDKGDVWIKVYDSSDRLLFRQTFEDKLIVKKKFNFKKAFKDEYTIIVKNNNDTYYENVAVN